MALGQTLYNVFLRRSSTFVVTILVGAVFFERIFDKTTETMWDRMNRGVRSCFSFIAHLVVDAAASKINVSASYFIPETMEPH